MNIETQKWLDWRIGALILLAAIAIPIWRATTSAKPKLLSATEAYPTVAVVPVERRDLFNEVTYPADFRPFAEVELHAKVSGYVQKMYVDFHDRVQKGQLLATLEAPELQDQLHNAMALQQKVEAKLEQSLAQQ